MDNEQFRKLPKDGQATVEFVAGNDTVSQHGGAVALRTIGRWLVTTLAEVHELNLLLTMAAHGQIEGVSADAQAYFASCFAFNHLTNVDARTVSASVARIAAIYLLASRGMSTMRVMVELDALCRMKDLLVRSSMFGDAVQTWRAAARQSLISTNELAPRPEPKDGGRP